jgi:spermidine synthase
MAFPSTVEQPAAPALAAREHILRFPAGVACVSFAALLLELALTRVFSVVLFYHFAFLVISIALLGLGAGGVFAHVMRWQLAMWQTRTLATWLCVVNATATLVMLEIVLHIPVSLQLDSANFGKLTVIYLVSAVPFFFTGLLLSSLFARERHRISQLYGADLIGGALACLAVVPLLNLVGGPNAILFAAVMMAVAGSVWADERRKRTIAFLIAGVLAALLVANFRGKLIDIVYAKGMFRDEPWVLFARWNAISRVEVDQAGDAKMIVIDADASTFIMNVDPHGPIHPAERKKLFAAPSAVVNILRPQGKYAIIGPGGGVDVLRALVAGSKDVTGIEINPLIANDIMRSRYSDYSHHLYESPEVRIHVGDGRSFIRRQSEQYDVVQMTLVDTWASTAAGAFALSENSLYTVEAFREYFAHLKPDGMIAITRWEFSRPREALRVVSQAMTALQQQGIMRPRWNVIVISEGELNVDGRPVTVIAKKSAFSWQEIEKVRAHVKANPNLRLLYPLERAPALSYNADSLSFHNLLTENDGHSFALRYPYDVSPVTDNAPFFFFTLKTRDAIRAMLSGTGTGIDWKVNLGVAVLFLLLLMSLAAVLLFLILPLALHKESRLRSALPLSYFVALGLGYILVEIAFIQRLVLFLGHPTYALTVVVFLMLLASGLGSIAARRWLREPKQIDWILSAIVALIAFHLWVLPRMLPWATGFPFGLKMILSAILLVPLAFLMGMPFPTGLRALTGPEGRPGRETAAIEWAWAMNASATVLGSVLAMVIAIHFGLTVTLLCAALAYTLANATRGLLHSA